MWKNYKDDLLFFWIISLDLEISLMIKTPQNLPPGYYNEQNKSLVRNIKHTQM